MGDSCDDLRARRLICRDKPRRVKRNRRGPRGPLRRAGPRRHGEGTHTKRRAHRERRYRDAREGLDAVYASGRLGLPFEGVRLFGY